MISKIRNSLFIKVLWGLMGIYLLNISVDPIDPNPEHIPEDLSINDQESIIELVVETILGYENAMEEYDDHDTEDHHKKNTLKIDLALHLTFDSNASQSTIKTKKQIFIDYKAYSLNGFHRLNTPPPKI